MLSLPLDKLSSHVKLVLSYFVHPIFQEVDLLQQLPLLIETLLNDQSMLMLNFLEGFKGFIIVISISVADR